MGNGDPKPRSSAPTPHTVAVAATGPVDVMIAPRAATATPPAPYSLDRWEVMIDAWRFANQWQRAAPDRHVHFVSPTAAATPAAVQAMLSTAVNLAAGREVILSIGHGGAGSKDHLSVFDTLPQGTPFERHGCLIDEDVVHGALNLLQAQRPAAPSGGVHALPPSQLAIGRPPVLRPKDVLAQVLVDVGALMVAKNVTRFTVLSCNVAQAGERRPMPGRLVGPAFVQAMADVLRTPVRMYDGWIATGDCPFAPRGPDGKPEAGCWITRDHDHPIRDAPRPGMVGFNDSFHEVPDRNPLNDGHSVIRSPLP